MLFSREKAKYQRNVCINNYATNAPQLKEVFLDFIKEILTVKFFPRNKYAMSFPNHSYNN